MSRKKKDDDITIHAKSYKGKILIYSISGGKAEIVKFNEEIVWGEMSEGERHQVCTILNYCFVKEDKQGWSQKRKMQHKRTILTHYEEKITKIMKAMKKTPNEKWDHFKKNNIKKKLQKILAVRDIMEKVGLKELPRGGSY